MKRGFKAEVQPPLPWHGEREGTHSLTDCWGRYPQISVAKLYWASLLGSVLPQQICPHACFQHQPNGDWGLLGGSSHSQPAAPKDFICYCFSCPDQIVQLIMIHPVFLLLFPGISRPGCLFVWYFLFLPKPSARGPAEEGEEVFDLGALFHLKG